MAVLVWTSLATVASAAADKNFMATVSPGPLAAGASYGEAGRSAITLTITNKSSQAQLGSANVTLPPGLTLTDATTTSGTATATPNLATNTVELRNLGLQPNGVVTASVSARVECAANHASYTWSFVVKQANDFNGTPGNNLSGSNPTSTVSGHCQLTFSKQPAHAEKSPTVITSQIYHPLGDAVTVSVIAGDGHQTVAWWSGTISLVKGNDPTIGDVALLTGGLSGPAVDGAVTFTPSINVSATGYTVIANDTPGNSASQGTSTGLTSQAFNIVDDATICAVSAGCSAVAGDGQKTKAQVDASVSNGAAGDLVILSINDPTVSLHCGGYAESSDIVVFNVTDSGGITPSGRSKNATLTLRADFVTKSASKYQVCYDSGSSAPFLLPTCASKNPVPPCVVSQALDKSKNLVIVVSSPPGDPKLNF